MFVFRFLCFTALELKGVVTGGQGEAVVCITAQTESRFIHIFILSTDNERAVSDERQKRFLVHQLQAASPVWRQRRGTCHLHPTSLRSLESRREMLSARDNGIYSSNTAATHCVDLDVLQPVQLNEVMMLIHIVFCVRVNVNAF